MIEGDIIGSCNWVHRNINRNACVEKTALHRNWAESDFQLDATRKRKTEITYQLLCTFFSAGKSLIVRWRAHLRVSRFVCDACAIVLARHEPSDECECILRNIFHSFKCSCEVTTFNYRTSFRGPTESMTSKRHTFSGGINFGFSFCGDQSLPRKFPLRLRWLRRRMSKPLNGIKRIRCARMTATRHFPSQPYTNSRLALLLLLSVLWTHTADLAAIFSSSLSEHTKKNRRHTKKRYETNNTQDQSHREHTTPKRTVREYIWQNQNTIKIIFFFVVQYVNERELRNVIIYQPHTSSIQFIEQSNESENSISGERKSATKKKEEKIQ